MIHEAYPGTKELVPSIYLLAKYLELEDDGEPCLCSVMREINAAGELSDVSDNEVRLHGLLAIYLFNKLTKGLKTWSDLWESPFGLGKFELEKEVGALSSLWESGNLLVILLLGLKG